MSKRRAFVLVVVAFCSLLFGGCPSEPAAESSSPPVSAAPAGQAEQAPGQAEQAPGQAEQAPEQAELPLEKQLASIPGYTPEEGMEDSLIELPPGFRVKDIKFAGERGVVCIIAEHKDGGAMLVTYHDQRIWIKTRNLESSSPASR